MINLRSLRNSITGIASTGVQSVASVRDSFSSGIAPLQTVSSGSAANFIKTFSQDSTGSILTQTTARHGLLTAPGGSTALPPKVELDSVEVVEDRARGILDQFAVVVTVSISERDALRADRIKVFRAEVGPARVPRPSFAALMDAPEIPGKGADILMSSAMRAAEIGVGNKLTNFIQDSPNDAQRAVTSPDEQVLRAPVPQSNTNKTSAGSTGLLSLSGADRSVVDNLTFYLNRRAVAGIKPPSKDSISVGSANGINVLKGSSVSPGSFVQISNSMRFVAIGTVGPHSPGSRKIGHVVEMQLFDPSVVHGMRYAYYAACVGSNGELGPRSRIVGVTISRTVPPKTPSVLYSVTAGVPRMLIKCDPGTSHAEVFRSGRAAILSSVMGSDDSLIVEGPSSKVGEFYHAGDLGLGPDGSTCFVDTDIVPGDRVTYRIYSVDAYGLKSQTPFSCSLKIPAHGETVPLSIPSITTEQVSVGSSAIRVAVTVDDPRIVGFLFSRRDVNSNERAVHQANQPELFTLGTPGPKRAKSRRGPTPLDLDWPSVIMSSAGSASFVDTSVRIDHTYQYAVIGIDNRGNKTLLIGARPVGVFSKPVIDPPTNLEAKILVDANDTKAVILTWTPGTLDFSPNHLLGDQDVLAATAVRSAYQVERRLKGAPFWDAMPATTESYFVDRISTNTAPPFRPSYVTKGLEYEYRVISMQSGGFVSPRTDSISVSVSQPPPAITTLWARSTNIAVRPLNVVVSWDTSTEFVDHWEVQRATVNKIFASRIQSLDSSLARGLDYQTVARISPESSRAAGIATDLTKFLDKSIYVGNRFYVDGAVDPANSYFYRVRSVGKLRVTSDWTYAGVSLVDHAHDRKLLGVLSDAQKIALATTSIPIVTRETVVATATAIAPSPLTPVPSPIVNVLSNNGTSLTTTVVVAPTAPSTPVPFKLFNSISKSIL